MCIFLLKPVKNIIKKLHKEKVTKKQKKYYF